MIQQQIQPVGVRLNYNSVHPEGKSLEDITDMVDILYPRKQGASRSVVPSCKNQAEAATGELYIFPAALRLGPESASTRRL